MTDLLLIITSPTSKKDIKILDSYHSNLCRYIKLVRVFQSVLNKIVMNKNLTLFTKFIWYILTPHFYATSENSTFADTCHGLLSCLHSHTQQVYQIMTEPIIDDAKKNLMNCMRILFFGTLLCNREICNAEYCEKLSTKLIDIDDVFPANITFNDHSSLTNIPLGILGRIMSFLSMLNTIQIERTCTAFFLAADQIVSFSDMDFSFVCKVRKYNMVCKEFFKRFIGVSSLSLPLDAFKIINEKLKFIEMFKQLNTITLTINNRSDLNSFLISIATNRSHNIEHLTLQDCYVDLCTFECIKQFNQLYDLTFSSCKIQDAELENSENLWQNYDLIQTSLCNIKRFECQWGYDDDIPTYFVPSLTLIRMMITQNMEVININACMFEPWREFHDFEYYCTDLSKFQTLKITELNLSLCECSEINYSSQQFCDELIPYVKCLERLIIGEWWSCEYVGTNFLMEDILLYDFENNFLFRIVSNNLDSLKEIEFNSFYPKIFKTVDNRLFAPLLALYKLCIFYPDWCRNVFDRFEFFKELECSDEEYDVDWIKTLHFIKDTASLLIPIFKQNNIKYSIKIGFCCCCTNETTCVVNKCEEIFPLSWHFNDREIYLTDKIPDYMHNQRLITDYFERI